MGGGMFSVLFFFVLLVSLYIYFKKAIRLSIFFNNEESLRANNYQPPLVHSTPFLWSLILQRFFTPWSLLHDKRCQCYRKKHKKWKITRLQHLRYKPPQDTPLINSWELHLNSMMSKEGIVDWFLKATPFW